MKNIPLVILITLVATACSSASNLKQNPMLPFESITEVLSTSDFEKIKNFILIKGDRQTYRQYDGNNPRYFFNGFSAHLAAGFGQHNINNDLAISDLNELTLFNTTDGNLRYITFLIIRKGDISKHKNHIDPKMQEEQVYLINTYSYPPKKFREQAEAGIAQMLKEIKETK